MPASATALLLLVLVGVTTAAIPAQPTMPPGIQKRALDADRIPVRCGPDVVRDVDGECAPRPAGTKPRPLDPAKLRSYIDQQTAWVTTETNGEPLWAKVRSTVENLLNAEWRAGRLVGSKPEQAYFVRCDRTTMTQRDLYEGRLVFLVGVAMIRPAEFEVLRFEKATAGSKP